MSYNYDKLRYLIMAVNLNSALLHYKYNIIMLKLWTRPTFFIERLVKASIVIFMNGYDLDTILQN